MQSFACWNRSLPERLRVATRCCVLHYSVTCSHSCPVVACVQLLHHTTLSMHDGARAPATCIYNFSEVHACHTPLFVPLLLLPHPSCTHEVAHHWQHAVPKGSKAASGVSNANPHACAFLMLPSFPCSLVSFRLAGLLVSHHPTQGACVALPHPHKTSTSTWSLEYCRQCNLYHLYSLHPLPFRARFCLQGQHTQPGPEIP